MTCRQAVIELGSANVKAGLWEQTFLPTHLISSYGSRRGDQVIFGASQDGKDVVYPIIDGRVADYGLLEALLHVLKAELGLAEPLNDTCLLLVIPARWDVSVQAALMKIVFEKIGLGGLYFGEASVMAAFGCGSMNSIVVDVGRAGTEISVVWDGQLVRSATEVFPVGGAHVESVLSLPKKPSGWSHLTPEEAEAGVELFFQACGGIDLIIYDTVLQKLDQDHRAVLLESIVLTGLGSQIPGLSSRLVAGLQALLPISEYCADHQGKKVALKRVPEYYPEVWEKAMPVAAWFGAGITSKMVFPDPKAFYSREEYSQQGSQLLHTKPL